MDANEEVSFYDKLRHKNFLEKQEMMRKLGVDIPAPEPIQNKSPSPVPPVPAKRGRPRKKPLPPDSSDEDYDSYENDPDDEDWENGRSKKKRKREKKSMPEKVISWNDSSVADKTTVTQIGRYPKRDVFRPKYEDDYTPGSDDMLYCADCKREWEGDCLEHGPLLVIEDTAVPRNINDKSRAMKTAPSIITVADSKIPEAGSGVWARDFIPARVRFGPYDGKRVSHDVRNPYTWLIRKNGRPHFCVDATEPGLSNWMRFVNCARYDGEQNLEAFQYFGNIYYRTLRRISPHEELLVWYGDDYGRQLGIDPEICDAQDEEKWREMRFKCPGCEFSYISPMYLERHKKVCRQLKSIEIPGKTYQCHGCNFLYSDADYLKRHKRFCRKLQYISSGTNNTLGTRGTEEKKEKSTEKSEKSGLKSQVEDRHIKAGDEQTVNTTFETERRPSLSFRVNSEMSEVPEKTTQKSPNQTETSAVLQPEISAAIQPSRSTSSKRGRSTSIQPEVAPEIPAEETDYIRSVENDRETSSNINSVISVESRQGSASEIMSDAATKSEIEGREELKKIQEAYVLLERIPWFSDTRAAEKPHLCTDCNERFSERHALDSHVLQHRMETLFVCPVSKCKKTFSQERRLWEHVEIHFNGISVVSSAAPSKTMSPSKNVQVPGSLKFFVCPKCHKFFSEREKLRNHPCVESASEKALSECTTVETAIEEKCYSCFDCKESFESLQHLTLHQISHRAGYRFAGNLKGPQLWSERRELQSCLVNGETALFSGRMGEFSLTHTLTTAVTVKFGDELFSTESSLLLTNRTGVERKVASISAKKTSERNNTRLAISGSLKNYLNTPKGAFVCSKCNLMFSQKGTLIVHRRTHRVERPFVCRLCKKGFLHSLSFQRHILVHKSQL